MENQSWLETLISTVQDITKSYFEYDLGKRQIQAGYTPQFGFSSGTSGTSGNLRVSEIPTQNDFSNYIPLLLLVGGLLILFLIKK